MVRAAFQGMLDFFTYGAAWVGWRALQFALAALALLFVGSAWAGIGGILIATILATLVLLVLIFRRTDVRSAVVPPTWEPFQVTPALPFLVEYGIFILVSNFDVLIAYSILTNEELGVYSASSFLPKAIVTAMLPITQVMVPVMTAAGEDWRPRRNA